MKIILSSIAHHEAEAVCFTLRPYGIEAFISGGSGASAAGPEAAPKTSLFVLEDDYEEAAGIIRENHPELIPVSDVKVCSSCIEKGIPAQYEITDDGWLKTVTRFMKIRLLHKSFCPGCKKLH